MNLIIENFTDDELMGQIFDLSTGKYPKFYKVYKITKKQVYLILLEAEIANFWEDEFGYMTSIYVPKKDVIYRNGGVCPPVKKIIKRDEIDKCKWTNEVQVVSYMWN
jgi:hypothetical protein